MNITELTLCDFIHKYVLIFLKSVIKRRKMSLVHECLLLYTLCYSFNIHSHYTQSLIYLKTQFGEFLLQKCCNIYNSPSFLRKRSNRGLPKLKSSNPAGVLSRPLAFNLTQAKRGTEDIIQKGGGAIVYNHSSEVGQHPLF